MVARSCQEDEDLNAKMLNNQVVDSSRHTENKEEYQERDGFQIRLVTAEMARNHAKEVLKETSEPSNGVLAFNGEFVSGNTTIVCKHSSSYN